MYRHGAGYIPLSRICSGEHWIHVQAKLHACPGCTCKHLTPCNNSPQRGWGCQQMSSCGAVRGITPYRVEPHHGHPTADWTSATPTAAPKNENLNPHTTIISPTASVWCSWCDRGSTDSAPSFLVDIYSVQYVYGVSLPTVWGTRDSCDTH